MKQKGKPAKKKAASVAKSKKTEDAGIAKGPVDLKPETYKMKEELITLGDDFWIETESGRKVFKVDGKMIAVRDKLSFESDKGKELAYIASKFLTVKDKIRIERVGGGSSAWLKKDLLNIAGDNFILEFDNGQELELAGNFLDHEYSFRRDRRDKVAEVSKRWFHVRDTYGVEIDGDQDHIMILAATVAMDQSSHDTF